MPSRVCSIWLSADIPISNYIVLKRRCRIFVLEPNSRFRVKFLVKTRRGKSLFWMLSSSCLSLCFLATPRRSTEVGRWWVGPGVEGRVEVMFLEVPRPYYLNFETKELGLSGESLKPILKLSWNVFACLLAWGTLSCLFFYLFPHYIFSK